MATPHLTSREKYGSLDYKNLHAHAGHLAVIRKMSYWSDKTMTVTPTHEKYTSAASYVLYATESEKSVSGDNQPSARVVSLFNAKTADSWKDGHKCCFVYWSRGDKTNHQSGVSYPDDWTFDPYYAKVTTKTGSAAETEGARTSGCGASWSALYFNLYAFPLKRVYGTNGSNLSMKLRLYNPSLLSYDWQDSGSIEIRTVDVPTSSDVASACLNMRYNVSDTLGSPPSFDVSGNVAAKIDFSSSSIVNQGKMSGYDLDSEKNFCRYDPWNNMAKSSSATLNIEALNATLHYRPSSANAEYYSDVEMTDDMKKKLFGFQHNGSGGFWLTIGPTPTSFYKTGHRHGLCTMAYFSRVELVIRAKSVYSFNQ